MLVYPLTELKAKIIYRRTENDYQARIVGLNQKIVQVDAALSESQWENLPTVTIYLHVCGEWKPYYVRGFRPVFGDRDEHKTCFAEIILDDSQVKSFARGLSVARSFSTQPQTTFP